MNIKLYTEEEVRKAFKFWFDSSRIWTQDDVIRELIAIELPSDEEIEKEAPFSSSTFGFEQGQYQGFIVGAKYVIKKIQGGNK